MLSVIDDVRNLCLDDLTSDDVKTLNKRGVYFIFKAGEVTGLEYNDCIYKL